MSVPMFHPALYVLLLASLSGGRAPAQALADWELQGRADGLARPDTPCQDFLQAIGRKPAGLEHVGCTQDDVYYIKPMQAHYRVAGARAEQVEGICMQRSACPCCATPAAAGAMAGPTPGVKVQTR